MFHDKLMDKVEIIDPQLILGNINCVNSYVAPMFDLKVLDQGYYLDICPMLFQYQLLEFQHCFNGGFASVSPILGCQYCPNVGYQERTNNLTFQRLADNQPMLSNKQSW